MQCKHMSSNRLRNYSLHFVREVIKKIIQHESLHFSEVYGDISTWLADIFQNYEFKLLKNNITITHVS